MIAELTVFDGLAWLGFTLTCAVAVIIYLFKKFFL